MQYTVRKQLFPLNSKGRQESSQSRLLIRIMHQTASIKYCLYDVGKRHGPQDMTLFSDIPQWDTFSFFILSRRVWLNLLSLHWDERKGLLTVLVRTLSESTQTSGIYGPGHTLPTYKWLKRTTPGVDPFNQTPSPRSVMTTADPALGTPGYPLYTLVGSFCFEILSPIKIAMG